MDPFQRADGDQPLVELIYQKRFLARGPRIVAIGGGTGLSILLRGLKEHTSNLTAIVTVADDGGSSGVLRTGLGIPPVGDIRNCIAALADAEPLMSEVLQYRFPEVPGDECRGPGRPCARKPPDRGDDGGRGRRFRGRRPAGQSHPRGARPRPAGDRHAVDAARQVCRRLRRRRPVADHADDRHRARLAEPDRRAGIGRCPDGDRGGRADRARARQPVHEPAAEPADPRHPRRGPGRRRACACSSATWPPRTARPPASTWPPTSRSSPRTPRRASSTWSWPTTSFGARTPPDWSAEPVKLRWPPVGLAAPRLVLDDVVDPDNAHHHDPVRLAGALIRTLESNRGSRHRAVSRSA